MYRSTEMMKQGKVNGYICLRNPVASFPNKNSGRVAQNRSTVTIDPLKITVPPSGKPRVERR